MKIFAQVVLVSYAVVNGSFTLHAEDWPNWRGPQRNGISKEGSGWLNGTWISEKPLWTETIGEGSSSPVVVDGKLYTLGWSNGQDMLSCIDAKTGKSIWEKSYASPRFGRKAKGDQGLYSGPSSTPEFDVKTGMIYTLSCDGELRCWNAKKTGELVWHKNLYDEYDPPQRPRVGRSGHRDYGFTSSPLVHNDWLIVEVGGSAGTLVGFDKKTGEKLWQSQATHPAGHTGGPVLMTIEKIPCVAVHHFEGLLVARLDKSHLGETLAEYPWKTSFANNIATPAVFENNIILTSAYNHYKMARLRISLNGEIDEVWKVDEASKVCSPVIHDGNVYVAWQNVYCLDFETGKKKWSGSRVGDPGSIIVTSDNRLIAWGGNGTLLLAESATLSPEKYTEVVKRDRLSRTDAWPHVVLADGKLYCKDRRGTLLCFRIGQK